jgi:DNA-binding HxlR family transcriptional regulator
MQKYRLIGIHLMPVTYRIPAMKPKDLPIEQKIKYVQDTLYVISGKWKLPILLAMNFGARRFRDIQRAVPKITTKVLSKELKDLETNLLVIRTVYDTSPPTVEYTVSPYCKSLKPLVDEMILWGYNHRKKLITQP